MSTVNQNANSLRFHIRWISLSATIGALSVAVLQSDGWDHEWAISALLWFSLSAAGPAFVALALHEVSKLRGPIADISAEPLDISVKPVHLAISGIAFLSIALETTLSVDVFPFIGWARVTAFIVASTFFLSYGALAYVYGAMFLLAVRLGKVRVRRDIFSWPHESIAEIHSIYFHLFLIGSTSYLLSVAIVRFTPWATTWLDLNQPWVRLWVFPPGLAAIVFFVAFSVALHKVLLQCRVRAEREIGEQLQRIYDLWKTNREPSAEGSISALLKWRETVRLERLWPMDLKAGIVTIVTLLIPTIQAIAKLMR
jgi:hypothetical protein